LSSPSGLYISLAVEDGQRRIFSKSRIGKRKLALQKRGTLVGLQQSGVHALCAQSCGIEFGSLVFAKAHALVS
jgi:hypothetical protein